MQNGQTEPQALPEGYPKAYVCTPRGEVCSKHKAIKTEEIRFSRISYLLYYDFFNITKGPCYPISLPCVVCAFCYSPFVFMVTYETKDFRICKKT